MSSETAKRAAPNLALGVIGNCAASALVDRDAAIVWSCVPRFDGDPVFYALLDGQQHGDGMFAIDLEGCVRSEQQYLPNTAVLCTRLFDAYGNAIEVIDFAPRFIARGRMYRPLMLVRRVRAVSGAPRIRIRLRPRFSWGAEPPQITTGSHHVRYVGANQALRLTTSAPITYVLQETFFLLHDPISLVFGPDESLGSNVDAFALDYERDTVSYWRQWSRRLAVPLQWQDVVIRAAITLKLCVFEDTGAIVAALTTSIPEAPDTQRNWDYRYCWLRDAFFVVRALNGLSEVGTMEDYLRWLGDVIVDADGQPVQPLYGIGRERQLPEEIVSHLAGYRTMGPVRRGNQAYLQSQHDVYGNIVLGATQAFFDQRLLRPWGEAQFRKLEPMGEHALRVHRTPDAGMWELRTRQRVHTSSLLMSWAACDRLARIAARLGMAERASHWRDQAQSMRDLLLSQAWCARRGAFVESLGGQTLDASVLLMAEVGIIDPRDPRFVSTVHALGKALAVGPFLRRYEEADDFGNAEMAFNACTFWYIDALARIGEKDKAREIFDAVLSARNHLGLMAEDTHPLTREQWGNFPQTYSMAGLINAALRLSDRWESII